MTEDSREPHLVLLPGLDGTGDLFAPFLAELEPGVRTHVVSYPADRVLSIEQLADHAMAGLPQGPLILVAESFSGYVTLEILARAPERIEAVVLVAAFAEPPNRLLRWLRPFLPIAAPCLRWTPAFLLRWFCLGSKASPELVRAVRRQLSRVRPKVLASRLRLISRPSPRAGERFDVPCVYLQATRDRLVPAEATGRLADSFSSFQLEEVDGPHFLLQVVPEGGSRVVERLVHAHTMADDPRRF